jgi:hypothetical protein
MNTDTEEAEIASLPVRRQQRGSRIGTRPPRLKLPHSYGPAMSSLTPLQQRFVEGYVCAPMHSTVLVLEQAGYKGSYEATRKMAYRLMKSSVILDAIREASSAKLKAMIPNAVDALKHVIADPKHRDHVKATFGVLDRTGLHAVQESKHTVEHVVPRDELIARICALVEKHGLSEPKSLPSQKPELIEAEYKELEIADAGW